VKPEDALMFIDQAIRKIAQEREWHDHARLCVQTLAAAIQKPEPPKEAPKK
jgi:hypothetical protein